MWMTAISIALFWFLWGASCVSTATVPTIGLRNGVKMPLIAAGSGAYNNDEAFSSFSAALKVGFTAVDTAHEYGNQEGTGRAIRTVDRERVFVETKVPGCMTDPKSLNPFACYSDTTKILDKNLQSLNLSYVDLVLIHYPPAPSWIFRSCSNFTGACEMVRRQWKAMEEFYKAGKARAIGVSNYCPSCFACLDYADIFPMVNQIEYHLGMGLDPKGFMTYAKRHDMVIQAYGSLGNPPLDPRDPGPSPVILHGNTTTRIGLAHNKTSVQIALKWLVAQGIPAVTKSSNPKHLAEDLDLWSFNLTSEETAALNAMVTPAGSPSFACGDHFIPNFVV